MKPKINIIDLRLLERSLSVVVFTISFWLLGVELRDFSLSEKERTACKVPIRVKLDQIIYFKLISNRIEKLMEYSRAMCLLVVEEAVTTIGGHFLPASWFEKLTS